MDTNERMRKRHSKPNRSTWRNVGQRLWPIWEANLLWPTTDDETERRASIACNRWVWLLGALQQSRHCRGRICAKVPHCSSHHANRHGVLSVIRICEQRDDGRKRRLPHVAYREKSIARRSGCAARVHYRGEFRKCWQGVSGQNSKAFDGETAAVVRILTRGVPAKPVVRIQELRQFMCKSLELLTFGPRCISDASNQPRETVCSDLHHCIESFIGLSRSSQAREAFHFDIQPVVQVLTIVFWPVVGRPGPCEAYYQCQDAEPQRQQEDSFPHSTSIT